MEIERNRYEQGIVTIGIFDFLLDENILEKV